LSLVISIAAAAAAAVVVVVRNNELMPTKYIKPSERNWYWESSHQLPAAPKEF